MTYPRAIVYAAPWIAAAVAASLVGPITGVFIAFFATIQNCSLSEDKT